MQDTTLAESIYVRRRKSKFGSRTTSKESILETFWFPYQVDNDYVEVFLVTEDLQRILGIKESVPVEEFNKEYSMKENSKDIYDKLKRTLK